MTESGEILIPQGRNFKIRGEISKYVAKFLYEVMNYKKSEDFILRFSCCTPGKVMF